MQSEDITPYHTTRWIIDTQSESEEQSNTVGQVGLMAAPLLCHQKTSWTIALDLLQMHTERTKINLDCL